MGYSLWLLPPTNSKITASLISAIKSLGCSLARFSKQTFSGNDDDIYKWMNDYDPHISLIYAEKKDCNDEELTGRIDTSTIIGKTWEGGSKS